MPKWLWCGVCQVGACYLYAMKKCLFFSLLAVGVAVACVAQPEKFGLLQYKVPDHWQQQTRQGTVRYEWFDNQTQLGGRLTVFAPVAAAPKPDSSFRRIWRSLFDSSNGNLPLPTVIKRRYTSSGISYFEAVANPGSTTALGYQLLWVFHLDKQAQAMLFATANAASLKASQQTIADFLESVNPVGAKSKQP